MLKYSKYLLSTIIRKKAPYIIIICFFLIFDFTTWIQIREANKNLTSLLGSLSTFDKFFPFLFSVLFISIIIIYAFKQGESDGSELLIVAKPISRLEIVFGKFFVILIYMVSYTLLIFVNYFILSLAENYLDYEGRLRYAASLSIGGAIVMIIVASILIICASFLKRTGLLSLGIVAAAIVPIISFIMSPVSKGQPFGYKFLNKKRRALNIEGIDAKHLRIDISNIIDSENIYMIEDESQLTSFKTYGKEMWYKNIAALDSWYQWGRFYSLFQTSKPNASSIAHWKKDIIEIKAEDKNTISVGADKYVLYIDPFSLIEFPKAFEFFPMILNAIDLNKPLFVKLSLFDRMSVIQTWVERMIKNGFKKSSFNINLVDFSSVPISHFNDKTETSSITALFYALINKTGKITPPNKAFPDYVHLETDAATGVRSYTLYENNQPIGPMIQQKHYILKTSRFAKVGTNVQVFTSEKFIGTNLILIIWSLLGIGFLGLALLAFIKRDFR